MILKTPTSKEDSYINQIDKLSPDINVYMLDGTICLLRNFCDLFNYVR